LSYKCGRKQRRIFRAALNGEKLMSETKRTESREDRELTADELAAVAGGLPSNQNAEAQAAQQREDKAFAAANMTFAQLLAR
jgi:hypothetical protein